MKELEQKHAKKVAQERAKRRRETHLERARSLLKVHAFKREIRAHGNKDIGAQCKAPPEKERELIDRFYKLPKEERTGIEPGQRRGQEPRREFRTKNEAEEKSAQGSEV